MTPPTVHASAVLVGARAALIQGPAGSGKSRLVLALLSAARQGLLPFARLVGDDRVHVEAAHGRLLVRPAAALAGQIEVRGLGVRRVPYEPIAKVGFLVELDAKDAERVPAQQPNGGCSGGNSAAAACRRSGFRPPTPGLGVSADDVTLRHFGSAGGVKSPAKPLYNGTYGVPDEPPGRGRLLQCSNPLQSASKPLNLGFG